MNAKEYLILNINVIGFLLSFMGLLLFIFDCIFTRYIYNYLLRLFESGRGLLVLENLVFYFVIFIGITTTILHFKNKRKEGGGL